MDFTTRAVAIALFLCRASGIRDGFDIQEESKSHQLALDSSGHAIALNASAANVQAVRTTGWPNVSRVVREGTIEEYFDLLDPVLKAVLMSYAATHGSYRNEDWVNATLGGHEGWERLRDLEADPMGGGMHALVFWHKKTERGMVAFRGSDLGNDPPRDSDDKYGQYADFCAQKLLFEGAKLTDLPRPQRDRWSTYQLDYLKDAQALVRDVLLKLREATGQPPSLLLVGHSLGAGIATLVAGTWSALSNKRYVEEKYRLSTYGPEPQVVGFSSLAFEKALKKKIDRELPESVVLIYNVFDPIGVQAEQEHGLVGGTVCTYKPSGTVPKECATCYAKRPFREKYPFVGNCLACFSHTHWAITYFQQLRAKSRGQEPANKLKCGGAGALGEALGGAGGSP